MNIQVMAYRVDTEVLTDPSKWTKGWYYLDENNKEISEPEKAKCFCIYGAFYKLRDFNLTLEPIAIADPELLKLMYNIEAKFKEYKPSIRELTEWNDDPNTSFEDVKHFLQYLQTVA